MTAAIQPLKYYEGELNVHLARMWIYVPADVPYGILHVDAYGSGGHSC